jgi:hypothetical protein
MHPKEYRLALSPKYCVNLVQKLLEKRDGRRGCIPFYYDISQAVLKLLDSGSDHRSRLFLLYVASHDSIENNELQKYLSDRYQKIVAIDRGWWKSIVQYPIGNFYLHEVPQHHFLGKQCLSVITT